MNMCNWLVFRASLKVALRRTLALLLTPIPFLFYLLAERTSFDPQHIADFFGRVLPQIDKNFTPIVIITISIILISFAFGIMSLNLRTIGEDERQIGKLLLRPRFYRDFIAKYYFFELPVIDIMNELEIPSEEAFERVHNDVKLSFKRLGFSRVLETLGLDEDLVLIRDR